MASRKKLTKKELAVKVAKYNKEVLSKQPPQKEIDKAKRITRRQRQRAEAEAEARRRLLLRAASGEQLDETFSA